MKAIKRQYPASARLHPEDILRFPGIGHGKKTGRIGAQQQGAVQSPHGRLGGGRIHGAQTAGRNRPQSSVASSA